MLENGKIKGVITSKDELIEGEYVLLCVGREGSTWLNDTFEAHKIPMKQNQVDIGVRVECPNLVMDDINKRSSDGIFIANGRGIVC